MIKPRATTSAQRYHAEHVSITPNFFVSRAAISNDILKLLNNFKELKSTEYKKFKEVWDNLQIIKLQFSCIHRDCRQNFMGEIFAHFIKFLVLYSAVENIGDDSLWMRIGSLFGLYLMYNTQPSCFEKVPVKCMPIGYDSISRLSDLAHQNNWKDVFYVCYRMLTEKTWLSMVVYEPISDELLYYLKNVDGSGKFPEKKRLYSEPMKNIEKEQADYIGRKMVDIFSQESFVESMHQVTNLLGENNSELITYKQELNSTESIPNNFKDLSCAYELSSLINELQLDILAFKSNIGICDDGGDISRELEQMFSIEPSPIVTPVEFDDNELDTHNITSLMAGTDFEIFKGFEDEFIDDFNYSDYEWQVSNF